MQNNNQLSMNWNKLISTSRYNLTAKDSKDSSSQKMHDSSPFLLDLDRITFSNFFRTLQDKTQVHPLNKEARVRSRLTHSIEVASVGRSLGMGVGTHILKNNKELQARNITNIDFGYIIQAACLAHDIGNPPFGHQGEETIKAWVMNHLKEDQKSNADISTQQKDDLLNFDGNAHGFRILNNLGMYKNNGGFRLSFATLGAFVKYPRLSSYDRKENSTNICSKKIGIFQTEKKIFQLIAEDIGLIKTHKDGLWVRHPLVYLTEAADDICYSIADLEDGVTINVVDFHAVEKLLLPLSVDITKYDDIMTRVEEVKSASWYNIKDQEEKLGFLRSKAISNMVSRTIKKFIDCEQEILNGTFRGDLLKNTEYEEYLTACKNYARDYIFHARMGGGRYIEIATFGIIGEILNLVCSAIIDREENEIPIPKNEAVLRTLLKSPNKKGINRYEIIMETLDFVSTLSDHTALAIYKQVQGVTF